MSAIGMYGGSFDPVHRGHLALAQAAIQQFQLTRLYIVPAYHPPHKTNTQASFTHRLAMARLAFTDLPDVVVSDLERQRGGISFTIESVEYLQTQHPASDIYLLIGADTAEEIGTWKAPDRLARLVRLLVAPRSGFRNEPGGAWRIDEVSMGPVDISATQIRREISAGHSITSYVPETVAEYIARHRLYCSS